MANMSYCRFQNTLQDLQDCQENLWEEDLSEEEFRARKWLVKLSRQIAAETEDEDEFFGIK